MCLFRLTLAAAVVLASVAVGHAAEPKPDQSGDNARAKQPIGLFKASVRQAKRFIAYYESTVRPLEIEANRRSWTANVTGKEADYAAKQAAEEKLDLCLADPQHFADLKALHDGPISDPLLKRQIEILYLEFLGRQLDPALLQKISAKSNELERAFNVFRATVDGKSLTANDVNNILIESRDSAQRRAAWEAGKKVGPVVVEDLKKLVVLRNEAARKLGFKNYHVMQLALGEQSQADVLKLFDELDELTREPFHKAKAEIDAALAKSYGITVAELRPWHYHDPFFMEVPAVLGDLPESVYKPLDILKICSKFYDGIGLPIDDVIGRSDLWDKPGKNQHAFSTDIDREGDIRILESIVPGRDSLATTLHELGHSTYSKCVDEGQPEGDSPIFAANPSAGGATSKEPRKSGQSPRRLPYVLRSEAHTLTTEGIAVMIERFAQNVDWLKAMGAKIDDPEQFRAAAARLQRNRLLIFSRYCQVMLRFEMALYDNPDQDLNRLWWDLVEKYQEMKRPEGRNEPDFATKYHLVGAPAYYHNYMLGDLFASQVNHALIRAIMPGTKPAGAIYIGNKKAGEFLRQKVFAPGMTMNWNELTRYATGEDLNAKAYAEDINSSN